MDTVQTTTIRTYFAKLGLQAEVADMYLALHTHGPQTISALARTSGVERTRIYRLVDHLMETNLVELEMNSKRGIIKAAPVANLRILINRREEELRNLQDELSMVEQVLARNSLSDPVTRAQFYRGSEGIRQMLRNELRTKSGILGYDYNSLEEAVGKKFMASWTGEIQERKLDIRLLANSGTGHHLVDPAIFRIRYSCHIYDDVTNYYHWRAGEVFGVEVYNQDVADSQRQIFEVLWSQSKPQAQL